MLKQRILTALALIPLVFLAIWYLPTAVLALLVGALMLGCVWEWALFVPMNGTARLAYLGLGAGLMAAAHPWLWGSTLATPILVVGLCWWLIATAWLKVYPAGFGGGGPTPLVRGLLGLLGAVPCYVALWNLHALPDGRWLIYLLLALVWATDTGGYFVGKRFGKRKLAVQISPNKTWEGLWGGVALAAMLALASAFLVFEQPAGWLRFLLLGLGVSLISVVGDLSVSMFKRQTGIKDTGQLFPGHGGALDRLDSLMSAAPALCLAYLYLGMSA
jgi:phosphatidate cytidylyltransferase